MRSLVGFALGVASALVLVAAGGAAATRYDDLSVFTQVLSLVRTEYVEPIDEHRLLRGAIAGLMHELDPHSAFMDTEAYEEMQVDTRGEFHGLGIEITKAQGRSIEVVSPIEGTPAARAGIRARDLIVEICPTEVPEEWEEDETCRPTKEMTLFEAVQLMRGRRGTSITIHVLRDGFEAPRPFAIVRDVVQVASVEGEMLEPGYAYLRLRAFQERTADELADTLRELHDESPDGFRGLVLDLRDNPGGLLDQAVRVADHWLEAGIVVYTKGRSDDERKDYVATPEVLEAPYPIVVLVNEGSASASEIVAGALQDQQRALVLGAPTFGKGSVQTIFPLEDESGLRLTTALYYTPSGRTIQETGIEPDIGVLPLSGPLAGGPERLRERDLQGHFTQEDASGSEPVPVEEPAPAADSDAGESADAEEPPDLPLERALEVLKSWSYFEQLNAARGGIGGSRPEPAADARGDAG